jgi:DNA-directed RNA polymerase specialized sigma subunit
MGTKIELTEAQISKLVATEEKQLRVKFEKDLAAIRKKYEFVEIDINETSVAKQSQKREKLTDELFTQYWNEGLSAKEIAEITGYHEGYVYRIKKRLQLVR